MFDVTPNNFSSAIFRICCAWRGTSACAELLLIVNCLYMPRSRFAVSVSPVIVVIGCTVRLMSGSAINIIVKRQQNRADVKD